MGFPTDVYVYEKGTRLHNVQYHSCCCQIVRSQICEQPMDLLINTVGTIRVMWNVK